MASPHTTHASTVQSFAIFEGIKGSFMEPANIVTGEGGFQVLSYYMEMQHPSKPAVAGIHQGTGRISATDFNVVLLDRVTTALFTAYNTKRVIPKATLIITHKVGPEIMPLFIIELTEATITSFHQYSWDHLKEQYRDWFPFGASIRSAVEESPDTPDFSGAPVLQLGLSVQKISTIYTAAKIDGTPEGQNAMSFDLRTQVGE